MTRREAPTRAEARPVELDQADAVEQLRAATAAIPAAEKGLDDAVVHARGVGLTWRAIAGALGKREPNVLLTFRKRIPEGHVVKPDPAKHPAAIKRLRAAAAAIPTAERDQVRAVARARSLDVKWRVIAEVVGQETPNAIAKFKPLLVVTVTVRGEEER